MPPDEKKLSCILPWKALSMEELDGRIAALPCCRGWIREIYGFVDEAPLEALWNGEGARRIRTLIASGRQDEVCDRHCKYLTSGQFGEEAWADRIIDGPADFVANQRLNNAEIRERRIDLSSRPMMLKVITNLHCNIRCTMCFQKHFGPVESGGDFWEQIDACLPYAHEAIFQGGEATTDPGFRRFLAGAGLRAHPHVGLGLITNGTVFDEALQHAAGEIRMQFVNVSLNAATAKTYRRVARYDLFDRVVANIRLWISLASRHPRGTFPVYVSFVVMRSNFHELPEFLRLVEALGARPRLRMTEGDPGEENLLLRPALVERFKAVLDSAQAIASGEAMNELRILRATIPQLAGDVEGFDDGGLLGVPQRGDLVPGKVGVPYVEDQHESR